MLYLISTPIGNLGDITYRAVEVMKSCDFLLCEDTRHSAKLLAHYGIQVSLRSFHRFNEREREEQLVEELRSGKKVGLLSDAGTPLIADPGYHLVARCRREGLAVTALPGSCAAIAAVSLSGLPAELFQFIGFLPRKESTLKSALKQIFFYSGVTIAYESPQRLMKTLRAAASVEPLAQLTVARELTKIHEEVITGAPEELYLHFSKKEGGVRGEIVLLFSSMQREGVLPEPLIDCDAALLVPMICSATGCREKQALAVLAVLYQRDKKELYREIHHQK